jgi:tyrosine-specific transport protein
MISKTNRFIGALLLVAGTTIGAGMLALPVITGLAGFIPSLLLMVILWFFMLLTAFYLLEVNLRMKGETNFISMIHKTLGRPGEVVGWVSYLLLLYSLVAAYMVGCSQILADFFHGIFHFAPWIWPLLIFLVFGGFVYFGTRMVDLLNRFLMIGLIAGYLALIGIGFFHIDLDLLMHHNWRYLTAATPVVVTSFGYHIIIPTLTNYLEQDAKLLKRAIFMGSLIPLVVYILWQALAMGVIPVEGELSLTTASEKGLHATFCLKEILGNPWVSFSARIFALFAIITSLLGVSLSLSDFLADGLKIKRTSLGNLRALLLTFLPPLFFALFYPQGFILALHYAGIFVIILLALIPSLMAWFERYGKNKREFLPSDFRVPGGKAGILGAVFFSIFLLGLEVFL